MKNIEYRRKLYEALQTKYASKGLYPQTSKLRYVFELTANGQHYQKQLALETSVKHVTERYLRTQDLFQAYAIRFGVMIEAAKTGSGRLLTYPLTHPTETQKGVFLNLDAEAIWNGTLQLKTGSELTLEALPLSYFRLERQAPDAEMLTQKIEATDGVVELPEKINLVGQKDQTLILDFPVLSTSNISVTLLYRAFAVVEFHGFLVNGGSSTEMRGTSFNS
ncbi:MAG: hypothetical protein LBS01_04975 [Prevotellaceae bacterium]|jgi:hypothetical protein|nr:hypothetical protein [Prevotellaceae bacterium]